MKNQSGNANTTNKNASLIENNEIHQIIKVAESVQKELNSLIHEYKIEGNLDARDYLDDEDSDSQNSDDDSDNQDDKITEIIKSIPKKYRPYINNSIKDFLKEKEEFDKWATSEKKDSLPEIELQAVLDESENPPEKDDPAEW